MCAIHQPNWLPRLSTLAKLYAADYWIVLDDVQFARRDYQHRARLAALDDPTRWQWLSLPTHLPQGRRTVIKDAVLADPVRSRRRTTRMLQQHYGASPHWPLLRDALDPVLNLFEAGGRTADLAEASTLLLLRLLGWEGRVLHSSRLPSRPGRSQRLADLAALTGARAYLCGTGGMTYLQTELLTDLGIEVIPFRTPSTGLWTGARCTSAVRELMLHGPDALARELLPASTASAPHR